MDYKGGKSQTNGYGVKPSKNGPSTQGNAAPIHTEAGTRLNTYEYSSSKKTTHGGVANEKKQTYIFKEPTGGEIPNGDKKTYNAQKIVGNGTFGVVFKATVAETGETVAIKKVFQDKRYKNRELQILKELNHPHVTCLRHAFYTQGDSGEEVYLNIVMDYIPGNLYEIIKYYRQSKHKVPNVLIKLYSYQIFRSLAYIHGVGICHRDIKPQNLLVNPSTHLLKLCDFGSAKKLAPNEPNVSYICSRYYRAPELIFGATFYDCAIDVWSAGCVIAEMILGEPLFLGESALDQLVEIIKILGTPTQSQILQMNPNSEEFRLPQIKPQAWNKVLKNADPLVIDLIAKVLVYNPKDRLKPMEAVAHPYFNDLRNQNFQIQECKIPELFNFGQEELSGTKQDVLDVIIPAWKRSK
jgi:serine/threonine protein kinase